MRQFLLSISLGTLSRAVSVAGTRGAYGRRIGHTIDDTSVGAGGRQTVQEGSPSPLRSGRRSIELCEGQQMAWRLVRNRRHLDAVAAVHVQ